MADSHPMDVFKIMPTGCVRHGCRATRVGSYPSRKFLITYNRAIMSDPTDKKEDAFYDNEARCWWLEVENGYIVTWNAAAPPTPGE